MSHNQETPPFLVLDNVTIPMSDGTRLAAQIWLPRDAENHPVPAILEYIPYRKRDHKLIRDTQNYGYFARRGYAGVRVDLRGSGDSEGILRDEYLQQELDDGIEVIRWIGQQSWCTGKVGMFGLSWGGFNGLQLAAMQPPELAAVISVCSSDNRYFDDVHYMGGCLLTDNLSWASTMFGFNSCPPDPEIVGEKWRDMWMERLEGSGLWLKNWLEHQHHDDYWKHGSVCEDYAAIKVPVLAVSGWADGYTNTVFRLLEHLSGPRKGLIGPWGHRYPHQGDLQTIDFLGECLRWWDRWLKEEDTGVDKEPMLTAWMLDSVNPLVTSQPGHWIAESKWPTPNVETAAYALSPGELYQLAVGEQAKPSGEQTIQSPLTVGLFAGKWCSYSETTDQPWDQREDDGGALTFDTAPLEQELSIFGQVETELELSSDKPVAMIAVRLTDVAPNDRATRVTFGILNLTHRDSNEQPQPLEPGRKYRVRVPMNYIAQRFPAGHRIRLALSSSYWPLAWPSPESVRLTVYTDNCRLLLPVRKSNALDQGPFNFGKGVSDPAPKTTLLVPAKRDWEVRHNLGRNVVSLVVISNDARILLEDIGMVIGRNVFERYRFVSNQYDSLRAEATHERIFERGSWRIFTRTTTILTSTRSHFMITATLDAYEGDVRKFSKTWDEKIPRKLV